MDDSQEAALDNPGWDKPTRIIGNPIIAAMLLKKMGLDPKGFVYEPGEERKDHSYSG